MKDSVAEETTRILPQSKEPLVFRSLLISDAGRGWSQVGFVVTEPGISEELGSRLVRLLVGKVICRLKI